GSRALIFAEVYLWIGLPAFGAVVAAFVLLYSRSRALFRRAICLYLEHWQVFAAIGIVAIPIGICFNLLQAFLITRNPLEYVVEWFDNTAGARLTAVALVGGVQQLAMLLIISPAVIQAVLDIHRGQPASVARSYRLAAQRSPAIAA